MLVKLGFVFKNVYFIHMESSVLMQCNRHSCCELQPKVNRDSCYILLY